VCDFLLVISTNLGPISHRLTTIHPWQTDRQTDWQTDRRQSCYRRAIQHGCSV